MDKYNFQYCQKIVVFSKDNKSVLLARRKGESDFDSIFSFIGGKMETTDKDLISGIQREKSEEVGKDFIIRLYPVFNTATYFVKKDGNSMVLPHYFAQYVRGEIKLSPEYSEFQWVPVAGLETFKPKISTIPEVVTKLLKLMPIMDQNDFVEI